MSSKKDKREGKNKEESDLEVHSANSWETADLGDKQRNEKFLRLMGASKKEHCGKFVIGDQKSIPRRQREEEKHLAEELEEQYEHSMEHRLVGGKKGHLGLGFHPDEELDKPEVDEEVGVVAKEEASDEDESDEDSSPEEDNSDDDEATTNDKISRAYEGERKRERLEKSSESDEDNSDDNEVTSDDKKSRANEGQRKRESLNKSLESDIKKRKFAKSDQ